MFLDILSQYKDISTYFLVFVRTTKYMPNRIREKHLLFLFCFHNSDFTCSHTTHTGVFSYFKQVNHIYRQLAAYSYALHTPISINIDQERKEIKSLFSQGVSFESVCLQRFPLLLLFVFFPSKSVFLS